MQCKAINAPKQSKSQLKYQRAGQKEIPKLHDAGKGPKEMIQNANNKPQKNTKADVKKDARSKRKFSCYL